MPPEKSLNALLDQLDSRLGRLEAETGKQAEAILHEMDEIRSRFEELKDQEHLLAVERDQFEYLQSRLRRVMPQALRELGGKAALQSLRAKRKPERARWWWYLDEEVAAERRQVLKRDALILGVATVVIAALALVYHFFLAPDPALVAALRYENQAYFLLEQGNPEQALQLVDQALANQPDDPDLMIFKGLLLQKLDQDPQQVQNLFGKAGQILGSQEQFLLSRSKLNLQMGNARAALADLQTVLESNPDSALAHYYAGSAYESMGDVAKAMDEYNTGYNLADQQGQSELAATIRVAYAMLSQSSQGIFPTETP